MLYPCARAVSAMLSLMVVQARHVDTGLLSRSLLRARGGGSTGGDITEAADAPSRPSSIFAREEQELDQYSAALAGTYLLREERDKVLRDTMNPVAYWYLTLTMRGQYNRWMSSRWVSDEARQAQKRYLLQAGNVIRSNGLTTVRYNELSHALGRREDLRERVQRQAQLYRIQATGADGAEPAVPLEREQRPSDEAPRSRRRDGIEERRGDKRKRKPKPKSKQVKTKTMLFAKCLREVETLREQEITRLMDVLGCDELPPNICAPAMVQVSARFRRACRRFPLEAAKVVRSNGLQAEDFSRLSARSRDNLWYRWRVLRCVRKLDRESRRSSRDRCKGSGDP